MQYDQAVDAAETKRDIDTDQAWDSFNDTMDEINDQYDAEVEEQMQQYGACLIDAGCVDLPDDDSGNFDRNP